MKNMFDLSLLSHKMKSNNCKICLFYNYRFLPFMKEYIVR